MQTAKYHVSRLLLFEVNTWQSKRNLFFLKYNHIQCSTEACPLNNRRAYMALALESMIWPHRINTSANICQYCHPIWDLFGKKNRNICLKAKIYQQSKNLWRVNPCVVWQLTPKLLTVDIWISVCFSALVEIIRFQISLIWMLLLKALVQPVVLRSIK